MKAGAGRVNSIRVCGWLSQNVFVALALLLAELPWHTSGFAVPNTTSNQICTFDFNCAILGTRQSNFSHSLTPSLSSRHHTHPLPSLLCARAAARHIVNCKAPNPHQRTQGLGRADIAVDAPAQDTNASRRCIRTDTRCRRRRCAAALRLAMAVQTAPPSAAAARPTRATRTGSASTKQGPATATRGGLALGAPWHAQPLGGWSAQTCRLAHSTPQARRPFATAPTTAGARHARLNALVGLRVRARGTGSARTMDNVCATGETSTDAHAHSDTDTKQP